MTPSRPDDPAERGPDDDPVVRWLSLFTEVRQSELRATLLFFGTGFITLAAYYIARTLREGFILVELGAEARSVAVGVATIITMIVVPLYAKLRARVGSETLVMLVYAFFAITLLLFYFAWRADWSIGFAFFLWVGMYGLFVISQFWALASACWKEHAGKRLFPFIMIGANLGALAGAEVSSIAANNHGMDGLMIVGLGLLVGGMALLPLCWKTSPDRPETAPAAKKKGSVFGGFSIIAKDYYLILIALVVVMLNVVNSVGEYLFAMLVEQHSFTELAEGASDELRAEYVAQVYSNYMLWFTTVGLLLQAFVVSRLFHWIGVGRSSILLPLIITVSYVVIAFFPVFTLIRAIKIAENAMDYSLMGTIRHALFLPTSEAAKFDAKTAVDTFFWRFGDLLQAVLVVGINYWFDWGIREYALLAAALGLVFLAASVALSREYRHRVPDDGVLGRKA